MAKKFLTPIGLVSLPSDPASGSEGQLYFNTTTDVVKVYVNGAWTELTGGGGGGGAISVSASAPVIANEGDGWFDNTDGKFYIYDGSFWVEAAQTETLFSSYTRWTKLLSASTSLISGLDNDGLSLTYPIKLEQLFINGIFIDKSAYTATSGSTIVLDEVAYSGDLIEVLWFNNFSVLDIYTRTEIDGLLDNIDLTSAINTASAAAVNYLVDGAPGALDTLNELAAALDDNADILDLYITQSSASNTYLTKLSASTLYEPNIEYVSASPSAPTAGTLWIDSTNSAAPALKVYNGTTWIAVSGAASESGFHPFFGAYK
jgi:hypothetical protein